MKDTAFLQELENIATKLDVTVRYESGDFKGGLCRINSEYHIVVQKKLPVEHKNVFIAKELSKLDLSTIYILPQLREKISDVASVED